jgi:DHA1 family bicyclomycin/chloramphenicol resistance-like MFS transporter
MADLPPAVPPKPPPLPILVLVTALGALAMHAVLPALPELAGHFAIPDDRIGYVVTAYLAGLAITQLVVGPLSDRFGRRPVIICGMALFTVATVLCLVVPDATWLFAARALQAVGGCAGMVLGRAILRDCYSRDEAASRMGYLVTAMATGTMLAPSAGTLIVLLAGWRGVFIVFTLLGAGATLLSFAYLHETNTARTPRLNICTIFRNYLVLLRTPAFLGPSLNAGCQNAVWFALVTVMPVAIATVYGGHTADYALWVLLPMSAFVAGSFVAGRMSVRMGTTRMINIGMGISALGTLAILAVVLLDLPGPGPLFAAMVVYVFGNGVALPSLTAVAISVNPAITGAAAGLLGFLQWTSGVTATAIVSAAGLTNVGALHAVMIGFAVFSFVTLLFTRR